MEIFYREFPQMRRTELQLKMSLACLHLKRKRVAHEQNMRLAVSSWALQGSVADKQGGSVAIGIGFGNNFNAVLIRIVCQIKITLLLKIQRKQHHILYVKIVYIHTLYDTLKVHAQKGDGAGIIKDRSTKAVELCRVL